MKKVRELTDERQQARARRRSLALQAAKWVLELVALTFAMSSCLISSARMSVNYSLPKTIMLLGLMLVAGYLCSRIKPWWKAMATSCNYRRQTLEKTGEDDGRGEHELPPVNPPGIRAKDESWSFVGQKSVALALLTFVLYNFPIRWAMQIGVTIALASEAVMAMWIFAYGFFQFCKGRQEKREKKLEKMQNDEKKVG